MNVSVASPTCFSALQRAEIAEMMMQYVIATLYVCFSALQRAEIAEINDVLHQLTNTTRVSVLFNEPKLLKLSALDLSDNLRRGFSALQRAEIAEIYYTLALAVCAPKFQCSSTSRNC